MATSAPMDPMPSTTFIARLRAHRIEAGLSQAELADRMSALLGVVIDPSTITRVEQGRRAVRLDEAVAAARALDVSLACMLIDPDEMQQHIETIRERLAAARTRWDADTTEVAALMKALSIASGAIPPDGSHPDQT